jgi:hypothetical protein
MELQKCTTCKAELELSQFKVKLNGKINKSCMACCSGANVRASANYYANREDRKVKRNAYAKERREYYRDQADKFHGRNENYLIKVHRHRMATDPRYIELQRARREFAKMKNTKNPDFSSDVIGCNRRQFCAHIESLFAEGMTWENQGDWEFDHTYPLSKAYDAGPKVFLKAQSYLNIVPRWKSDNTKKGSTVFPEMLHDIFKESTDDEPK